jgi:hypothetical protein
MLGDIQYDSGKGYCKTDLITIRVPDLASPTLFKGCEPVMINQNNFESSANYAVQNSNTFIKECVAYQVMDEVEECWANYLLGEAQFDGTCDRICFADGFSSYSMNERTGVVILPKVTGSTIYFFPGYFDANKLDSRSIQNLISLHDARGNYNLELHETDLEDKIKIDYKKPLGSVAKYSIVQRIPIEVSTDYLSNAIDLIESDPERTGLEGSAFGISTSDDIIESGEEWEINYYEEENIQILTIAGTIIGARAGAGGAAAGYIAGYGSDSYLGTNVAYKGAAVILNKRGVC